MGHAGRVRTSRSGGLTPMQSRAPGGTPDVEAYAVANPQGLNAA
jgi:hypothetical protein